MDIGRNGCDVLLVERLKVRGLGARQQAKLIHSCISACIRSIHTKLAHIQRAATRPWLQVYRPLYIMQPSTFQYTVVHNKKTLLG